MNLEEKIARKITGFVDDRKIVSKLLESAKTISIVVTDDDISGKPIYAKVNFKIEKLDKPYFSDEDIRACFEQGSVIFAKGDEWFVEKASILLESEYKKHASGEDSENEYQYALNMSKSQAKKMIKLIYEQMDKATYLNSWIATNENGACAYSDACIIDCEWNIIYHRIPLLLKMPAYVKFQIDTDTNAMVIISFHKPRK